jgi:hypothetical protein
MSDKGKHLSAVRFRLCFYICRITVDFFSMSFMQKIKWIALFAPLFAWYSCSNEVDLTGSYEDTPIVYCLLNPKDTAHYIRIQKAFLVNGNVLETAQIPDSLRYDPADLIVRIQGKNTNTDSLDTPILFQHVPGAIKDSGDFAQEGFMLFKSTAQLNEFRKYNLDITNTKLDKKITSETGLVYTTATNLFINPNAGTIIFNSLSGQGYNIRWRTAINGRVYQPEIVFRWTEVNLTTNETKPDSAVWRLIPQVSTNDEIGSEMLLNLPQNSFFLFLKETVPVKPDVKRVIGTLTFNMYVGTEELNTYINVNKPSIGLIQEKPVYTNIQNGLGLFAGRSKFSRFNLPLAESQKDTLILSPNTDQLNFKRN